jgi:hypothetical protein
MESRDIPKFDIPNITVDMVRKTLAELRQTKAPVVTTFILGRRLKELREELAPALCALFNKSLSEGETPGDWKKAVVTPLHKAGEKNLSQTIGQLV